MTTKEYLIRTERAVRITEPSARETSLGTVLHIKVFAPGYRPLAWREVWEAFTMAYPGKWAVQAFPPREQLVDGKAVYHLFVCDTAPTGLDIRG